MAVVEFEGFEVGAHPWTLARVREAATATGPWTILETVPITITAGVVDTFETTLATLDNGWYSIVWIDADGNVSTPTGPVFNGQSGNHRAQLARMVAAEAAPVLSDDELDDLLAMHRRIDAAHIAPSQDGWTPTYDLAAAAAEGWRRKAGKAAAMFNFAEDGQQFQRSQVYAQCVSMADRYSRQVIGSVTMQRAHDWHHAR
jgi:hypothetical protein